MLGEPLSALDVSVQAALLDMLRALQARDGLSYLFVSHDIAMVAELCQRVVVLHQGRVVEQGSVETVLRAPAHEQIRALLQDALPTPSWVG